jgi:hypothetical protein
MISAQLKIPAEENVGEIYSFKNFLNKNERTLWSDILMRNLHLLLYLSA